MTTTQHRAKMRERRAAQLSREPGFTPVTNRGIERALRGLTMQYQLLGLHAVEAQDRALRQVGDRLPARRRARAARPRVSRNNAPEYRKSIWPASKVAR